ncbi:MAG: preprotein translocase subunit SecG [Gammaproteobacteria bacterium]|nr:preprotein translocase subunit SecG [Gammaproteobacteria bacterium]MDE0223918.1 preprotein translocase subunit SecG [Gammaproteobacteria bacterium]
MENLETVLLILLVADAIALATLILLQQGKGADIGAAFGSGGANTVFGSSGSASFLMKLTTWLAIGFFLISFGLAYTAKERAASLRGIGIPVVEDVGVEQFQAEDVGETESPSGQEPFEVPDI